MVLQRRIRIEQPLDPHGTTEQQTATGDAVQGSAWRWRRYLLYLGTIVTIICNILVESKYADASQFKHVFDTTVANTSTSNHKPNSRAAYADTSQSKHIADTDIANTTTTTINDTASDYKPKLIIHIGPKKTGSTSIQLNVFRDFQSELEKDFQIINLNYRRFKFPIGCEADRLCQRATNYLTRHLDLAHRTATNHHLQHGRGQELISLNSCEQWSVIRNNEIMIRMLVKLFQKWDVYIVMFYRPYIDWLVSKHGHHSLVEFRYESGYQNHHMYHHTITEYFGEIARHFNDTDLDALGAYQLYQTVLERLGLLKQQSALGIDRIKVIDMHSPNTIEKEFISYLPNANHTKNHLSQVEKKKRLFRRKNSGNKEHILGKRFMLEAWKQDIVSVGYFMRDVMVEKALIESGPMAEKDLPHVCMSDKQVEMVWQRHLANQRMFAPMIDKDWVADELELRRQFDEKKSKLCSVDVVAALKLDAVKKIFDDCEFHSKYLIHANLSSTDKLDPKWIELGCDESNRTMSTTRR